MKLRVFTAFSGYDSQCLALDRLGIDYELVGWSEIDKYAIQAHNALFPQWADRNFGDISKIDWSKVPDFDLFTYSSPCQDFSNAGKMAGGEEGSGTRSSLLWECRRAIEAKRPKYCLMENVANLVSKKFIHLFNKWQITLEEFGYTNFAKVLDAKEYNIPQMRKRIFLVSKINGSSYHFPNPLPLKRALIDILEKDFEEKYLLSDKLVQYFHRVNNKKKHNHKFKPREMNDVAYTIKTKAGSRIDDNYVKVVGFVSNSQNGRVLDISGLCYSITNGEKDGAPKIQLIKRGHGFYKGGIQKDNIVVPTISASSFKENNFIISYNKYGEIYRRLTPRECFRLMGVDDKDIDILQESGISDTQQYKLAGNSIVVDVLYHIFRKMFIEVENTKTTLF